MAFDEDGYRVRAGHAAESCAVPRHRAGNGPRRETTAKIGIKAKRLMAGWDGSVLRKVLAG